ncbi:hypothetical protein AAV94_03940 [Lampropedia cohaerens]|uniref:PIN-like domain-containing protein n=1 Tax=Lampropedia cohaerens TaxID=1610491 RepID=A0A0U1Q1R0_9BURK|nr:PIN domain-containing protein [Lampropedia cohaerens]KKW68682.1 hypothetical protein AAV94_03940 [Lampropedia cohaerens]
MRNNYVLIDYENVQPDMSALRDLHQYRVLVFVGANQPRIAVSAAAQLQPLGERARYVQINGSGRNALDFHIAFYVGKLSAAEPDAYFHVISKDSGFDPLIAHLREQRIHAQRSESVAAIPALQAVTASNSDERMAALLANLRGRKQSRPRSIKTLTNTIHAVFQKKLSDADVEALIAEMKANGTLGGDDNKLIYALE